MEGRNLHIEIRWAAIDRSRYSHGPRNWSRCNPMSFFRQVSADDGRAQARRRQHPDRVRERHRAGRAGVRADAGAARRKHHRLFQFREHDRRQMAAAAQGGRSADRPRRHSLQPPDGAFRRIVPALGRSGCAGARGRGRGHAGAERSRHRSRHDGVRAPAGRRFGRHSGQFHGRAPRSGHRTGRAQPASNCTRTWYPRRAAV